ncbi:hypothetical protein GN244_ATG17612 [Phytophthora infestans]|uniref:Uncharacterized protein n=1 Tax=Phytophthora infestans TaxID=4787 RepID=A0A833SS53_PHYIN|nr:hypothetical protein GN244_ATG17612 [Phytophthora infestans]
MEDAAFLNEVAAFLDQSGVCDAADEVNRKEDRAPTEDTLLLSSHQLKAETEKRLASGISPVTSQPEHGIYSTSTRSKVSQEDKSQALQDDTKSTESRRESQHAQASERRRRYRDKIRNEKEALMRQATELSTELTSLQTAQLIQKKKQARNLMFNAWRGLLHDSWRDECERNSRGGY